jgi:mono/diheme cytochrome c family protein
MASRAHLVLVIIALFAAGTTNALAAEPTLTIEIGGSVRHLSRDDLLKSPLVTEIDVPLDVTYQRAMHYRAIPMDKLLAGIDLPSDQILEAVATDGFVGALPAEPVLHPQPDGARAYLAIEPPDAPWPKLKGREVSAGPFYVVWLKPEASGVRSEQWPYALGTLRSADSPAKRWPALGVDPSLAANDPIRAGQTLFVTQCLACHRLNGAGSSDLGPDLNRPENPTEYFRIDALKRYIRNPAAVRHWANMQMQGFREDALSDHEIDLIIAYLQHMAGRKVQLR